ncbi:hypothetical protein [Phaffia rhodozyma]|uniref:Uncharacterized protein n=1 Tax=Phaffia rhodozyma TaxID=264483 RepID=A0A0F7SGZ5_PHARH|nr:hypothetical protein [Phaffia rhodozyma]
MSTGLPRNHFVPARLKPAATEVPENYKKSSRHQAGIKKVLWVWLNRWYESEGQARYKSQGATEKDELSEERKKALAVVDLACGSGEITEFLTQWYQLGRLGTNVSSSSDSSSSVTSTPTTGPTNLVPSIHPALQTNLKAPLASRPAFIPPARRKPVSSTPGASSQTDASTGSPSPQVPSSFGQSSLKGGQYASLVRPPALPASFTSLEILPTDAYPTTHNPLYQQRLPAGNPAYPTDLVPLTFHQIALSQLSFPRSFTASEAEPYPKFDMIICSFALHMVEEEDLAVGAYGGEAYDKERKEKKKSEFWALLWELSLRAEWLVVLNTNKRPVIGESTGWARWDLANWRIARQEGFGGKKEDEEDEEDEEPEEGDDLERDSAVEVKRDRVRMRVYRSVGGSA